MPSALRPELVLLDISVEDKWSLIDRMFDSLMRYSSMAEQTDLAPEIVRRAVLKREQEQATGLGEGFAFPHARIQGLREVCICVARPRTPVDFGAPDKVPAAFVCLMVVPEEHPNAALQVMSQFARLMLNDRDRSLLLETEDPEIVARFIHRRVLDPDMPILAWDIMRPAVANIYPDTPIREVTRIFVEHGLEAISVVDRDETLLGQITCDDLFCFGLPDFFGQLKSVSFIRDYDPFEKYFDGDALRQAKDVMSTDYAALPEDGTLLEIVFELAIRRHPKVYVVRDGKRIGVIDRNRVLDKVINI